MATTAAPQKCYACDAKASGEADHDGQRKPACKRHRERALTECIYCTGQVGRGGLDIDGQAAHQVCHREACR